jgi:hypothetical protein
MTVEATMLHRMTASGSWVMTAASISAKREKTARGMR